MFQGSISCVWLEQVQRSGGSSCHYPKRAVSTAGDWRWKVFGDLGSSEVCKKKNHLTCADYSPSEMPLVVIAPSFPDQ